MLARLFLSVAAISVLGGCGNFGFGSLSFGKERELIALHPEDGYADEREWRDLIAQVTALRTDKTASGVIVHAEGMPPRQGYWDAELVAENDGNPDENGIVTFVFRVAPSRPGTRTGTPYSRKVHVATFLSTAALAGVTQIRVVGENNAMTSRP